jgi:hypothetical protein
MRKLSIARSLTDYNIGKAPKTRDLFKRFVRLRRNEM